MGFQSVLSYESVYTRTATNSGSNVSILIYEFEEAKTMNWKGVLALGIVLSVSVIGVANGPDIDPQDSGALSIFINQLQPCLNFDDLQPIGTDFLIPRGDYCLYYSQKDPGLLYDFGYLPAAVDHPECGCVTLRRLVEGHHEHCYHSNIYESSLLPPDDAILVEIRHGPCQYFHLWINGDWKNPSNPPSLVTSSATLNYGYTGGRAFAYSFTASAGDCRCSCHDESSAFPRIITGYLVFWEAGDCDAKILWEWDDFWVVLIDNSK